MNALSRYLNGAIEELKLVRWPTRQQAARLSAIVIAVCALCAAFFGLVDFGLSKLLVFLLSLS